jgi:hypothetical protein
LRELVRYIHLNPIRAGIVSDLKALNDYPYSGHSGLVGREGMRWQDVDYVLRYFGKTRRGAAGAYLSYVEGGLHQGRREELTGGGLIRSLGGWSELKRHRLKGGAHVMSDERILGDSDFIDSVLSHAGERYERRYELKRCGYDLNRVVKRVAEIYGMDEHEVFSKGRQRERVNARSLFCYWAVRELGISLTDMGRRFGMSVPGVGYAVERGEAIVQSNNYQLIE